MAGQATVSIGDKTWTASLATTPQEWSKGLAGLVSLPPGTGMLFDLGADLVAPITTAGMLFPLDILWIGSSLRVVALARDIAPGNHITPQAAACYVLEVNAGETPGIEAGLPVALQEFPTVAAAFNIGDIVTPLTQVMVLMLAFGMLRSFMRALLAAPRRPALTSPTRPALPAPRRPAGMGLMMAQTDRGQQVYFSGGGFYGPEPELKEEISYYKGYRIKKVEYLAGQLKGSTDWWITDPAGKLFSVTFSEAQAKRDVDKAVSGTSPRAELEFFADSSEQCCASLDGTGLRARLEHTFQEAIARARKGG